MEHLAIIESENFSFNQKQTRALKCFGNTFPISVDIHLSKIRTASPQNRLPGSVKHLDFGLFCSDRSSVYVIMQHYSHSNSDSEIQSPNSSFSNSRNSVQLMQAQLV